MKELQGLFLALLVFGGCTCSDKQSLQDQVLKDTDLQVDTTPDKAVFTKQVLDKIIYSIPSPIEFTFLLKDIGADYSDKILNPISNVDNYASNYKKAINLGVYGADLGYANFYDKTQTSLSYLRIIKQLADDQEIGQFFDIRTLTRLASEQDNMDSLIYITMTSFDQIDSYLRQQNRGDLSVYMLIGGWMEGLYLATQIAKQNPNSTLVEVIGAQQYVLGDLNMILKDYDGNGELESLVQKLRELETIFNEVQITVTENQMTTSTVVDGKVVIQNFGGEGIELNAAGLETIVAKIEQIRKDIIRS